MSSHSWLGATLVVGLIGAAAWWQTPGRDGLRAARSFCEAVPAGERFAETAVRAEALAGATVVRRGDRVLEVEVGGAQCVLWYADGRYSGRRDVSRRY